MFQRIWYIILYSMLPLDLARFPTKLQQKKVSGQIIGWTRLALSLSSVGWGAGLACGKCLPLAKLLIRHRRSAAEALGGRLPSPPSIHLPPDI